MQLGTNDPLVRYVSGAWTEGGGDGEVNQYRWIRQRERERGGEGEENGRRVKQEMKRTNRIIHVAWALARCRSTRRSPGPARHTSYPAPAPAGTRSPPVSPLPPEGPRKNRKTANSRCSSFRGASSRTASPAGAPSVRRDSCKNNGKRFEIAAAWRGFLSRHVGADHIEKLSTGRCAPSKSTALPKWEVRRRCRSFETVKQSVLRMRGLYCVQHAFLFTASFLNIFRRARFNRIRECIIYNAPIKGVYCSRWKYEDASLSDATFIVASTTCWIRYTDNTEIYRLTNIVITISVTFPMPGSKNAAVSVTLTPTPGRHSPTWFRIWSHIYTYTYIMYPHLCYIHVSASRFLFCSASHDVPWRANVASVSVDPIWIVFYDLL